MSQRNVVYIIEDDEGVRQSLTRLLTAEGYEVSSFGTGSEFLDAKSLTQHACLILDVHLPDISGLELNAHLTSKSGEFPVVIISGFDGLSPAVKTGKFGAIDFLRKPIAAADLIRRVRAAFASYYETSKQQSLKSDAAARLSRLSRREREVMDLVVVGLASKNIAERLGLRVKTVENHRAHLKKKLGVDSVAELVQLAFMDRAPESFAPGEVSSLRLVDAPVK